MNPGEFQSCSPPDPQSSPAARRGAVHARHITGVRNFDAWLDHPLAVRLYNAFRQRSTWTWAGEELPEVPHCFTMVLGNILATKHLDMLEASVEPDAVYCCVKMYVRDLMLSQPPLLVAPAARIRAVQSHGPNLVHAANSLSAKQIETFSRLARLCQDKYGLQEAAKALFSIITDRAYDVHCLSFLRNCHRQFLAQDEGNAQLPYLPGSCWRLMAEFQR